jgi:hypothetical protein
MGRTVAELDEKIRQLQARKQKLAAREAAEARRRRTRQAAILGGWLMGNDPQRVREIVASLTRPQDRAAFDLAGPPEDPPPPATATE